LAQLIVIVAMFALLWLLFIRPQRRRVQAQQQLVSGIELGDEILTAGGIYGTVLEVRDGDELVVEIAPETRVRVARRAVAAVLPPEGEQHDEQDDEQEALEEAPKTEPNEEIRS
jgi:preprotein translocase subunit YajC